MPSLLSLQLFVGLFAIGGVLYAEDLTTTTGKVYQGFKVSKIEPDGLRVSHSSGVGKVFFVDLPEPVQKNYGYDPVKAAAFAKKAAEPAPVGPASAHASAALAKPAAPLTTENPMPALASTPAEQDSAKEPVANAPETKDEYPPPRPGRVYGMAEVLAAKFDFDKQVIRLEVAWNSASKIEQIGPDEYRLFVGNLAANQDFAFITFDRGGKALFDGWLRNSKKPAINVYAYVEADDVVPIRAIARKLNKAGGASSLKVNYSW